MSGILIAGGGIILGALVVWAVPRLIERFAPTKDDFALSKVGGLWELTRTGRRPALAIRYGVGQVFGDDRSLLTDGQFMGDLAPKGDLRLALDFEWDNIWFMWIDGRRRYSRTVLLSSPQPIRIQAVRRKAGDTSITT